MANESRREHSLPPPPETDEPAHSPSMFSSPPTVYVEPEAPDPFLIDEEGDALSDEEIDGSSAPISQHSGSPAHNVPLDLPTHSPEPENKSILQPIGSPLLNVNKDVPPPPPSESDDEEDDEAPELYLPGLILPTMFLPIPNVCLFLHFIHTNTQYVPRQTDPLTTLLNKYIYPPERRPPRDLTGEWQRADFHTLVVSSSSVRLFSKASHMVLDTQDVK